MPLAPLAASISGLPALLLAGIALTRVSLPAPPTEPGLLFRPADVPALQARRADPAYAPYFARTKALADARLGATALAGADDDLLARVAKGAAFLEALGEQPPPPAAGSGAHARYRDLALAALEAIRPRTPTGITGPGTLDPLQDSGRLQSMAEAYDMLRGSGVPAARDAAVRARIAGWANAMATDVVLPLRRNNHSLKAGAALVTAALALPDHGSAGAWLANGLDYVNDALAAMASDTGWYREGPYYLNYSLNNLASAAWHVRNRTGADWFAGMRPFVRFAIDTRQPDGAAAPFEEGLACVPPYPALVAGYAGDPIQGEMAWAWEASTKDWVNWENQQLHDVTLFCLGDFSSAPSVPPGPPGRFTGGDANVSVLRSGWGADARQATLFAALDYSDLDLIASRHNTRNPLDLAIAGAGETLLPASGGGPQVTGSARRGHYIAATSKNIVLVDGAAPFLMNTGHVALADRLDAHRSDGRAGVCDLASARVSAYAGGARVTRTVALLAGEVFVVADEVQAPAASRIALLWHGRGQRPAATGGGGAPVETTWTLGQAALDLTALGSAPLGPVAAPGWYAPRWNVEEAVDGLRLEATAADARFLTILEPRPAAAARRAVTDLSAGAVAAARIEAAAGAGGAIDLVALAPAGSRFLIGGYSAQARFVAIREEGGALRGFALAEATALEVAGAGAFLAATTPVTLAVEVEPPAIEVRFSIDGPPAPFTLSLGARPGIDLARPHEATLDGARVDATRFAQSPSGFVVRDMPPGARELRIAPATGGGAAPPVTGTGTGMATGTAGGGGGCGMSRDAGGGPGAGTVLAILIATAAIALRRARLAMARASRYDDSHEAEGESSTSAIRREARA